MMQIGWDRIENGHWVRVVGARDSQTLDRHYGRRLSDKLQIEQSERTIEREGEHHKR